MGAGMRNMNEFKSRDGPPSCKAVANTTNSFCRLPVLPGKRENGVGGIFRSVMRMKLGIERATAMPNPRRNTRATIAIARI